MFLRASYPMRSMLLALCPGHVARPDPHRESSIRLLAGPGQLAAAMDSQIESGAVDRWIAANPDPRLVRGDVERLARSAASGSHPAATSNGLAQYWLIPDPRSKGWRRGQPGGFSECRQKDSTASVLTRCYVVSPTLNVLR
jgi:hypothetical protein